MSQAHFRLASFTAAFEVSAEQFNPIHSLAMFVHVCVRVRNRLKRGDGYHGYWKDFFSSFFCNFVCEHPSDDRQHTQSSPTQKEQWFNQRDLLPAGS